MTLPLDKRDLDHILEHATPQFVELSEGRLFLTGATGLFGSWLLESIAHAQLELGLKFDVQFLSRDPDRFLAQYPFLKTIHRLSGLRGDIRNFTVPDGSTFTHMIHGATTSARETFDGESPLRKYDTVAGGTRQLLEFASLANAENVLYLSSGAVYGAKRLCEAGLIAENFAEAPDPTSEGSALGVAKRSAEFFCRAWCSDSAARSVKIARCFSFVGPRIPLDIHYAVGNFIRDGLANRDLRITGSGRDVRSYLYMADLITWLLKILTSKDKFNVYNVGSENGNSISDLAQQVAALFPGNLKVEFDQNKNTDEIRSPSFYVPSTERVRAALGVAEYVGLMDALNRTIRYHSR